MMDDHGKTIIIPTTSLWVGILERFTSRKFVLCVAVQCVASYALLWTAKMDGGTYLAFTTLVLGSYSAASIVDKKLNT
jgi:hypothetical protein